MLGLLSMTERRHKDDWYPTPPAATEALLSVEDFDTHIWEPACGDGAISTVLQTNLYAVTSTDLNDYGYGFSGRDFLLENKRLASNIITNPPYKLANQFIRHAIGLGVRKHAWLLRLAFLEGKARYQLLYNDNPPARIHVFSSRLTIWRGDEDQAWYGSTGKTAYAWFVWEQCSTDTKVSWL